MNHKIYIYGKDFYNKDLILVGIVPFEEVLKNIYAVLCIPVNLDKKYILNINRLTTELKLAEWDEIQDDEKEQHRLTEKLFQTFSKEEIEEKIIKPLMKDE